MSRSSTSVTNAPQSTIHDAPGRRLWLLLVIALMTSGCSTRDTVQNQLWHDQNPVLSTTIECSVFVGDLIFNAALLSAAFLLSGK